MSDFARSLRVDASQHVIVAHRGATLRDIGRLEEAERDLTTAVELAPDFAEAWYDRALLYEQVRDHAAAASDYARTLELTSENIDLLINYAWLLATSSDNNVRNGKLAKELALKGCELTGYENADLLEDLAAACAELGEFKKALNWQQKASALFENEEQVEQAVARMSLFQEGRPFRR